MQTFILEWNSSRTSENCSLLWTWKQIQNEAEKTRFDSRQYGNVAKRGEFSGYWLSIEWRRVQWIHYLCLSLTTTSIALFRHQSHDNSLSDLWEPHSPVDSVANEKLSWRRLIKTVKQKYFRWWFTERAFILLEIQVTRWGNETARLNNFQTFPLWNVKLPRRAGELKSEAEENKSEHE